jgi:hypothetical protein
MTKAGIDQDALIDLFAQASARQGETLRQAVSQATLKALQSRELTLNNIRSVLKAVTEAASAGLARNPAASVDLEGLVAKAVDGMDAALLKAVEANRRALQQFVEQGADLNDTHLKKALSDLEKMEDVLFSTVTKAAQAAGNPLQVPWMQVLESMKLKGTHTGEEATRAVQALMTQAQETLRSSRAAGLRAAQAMMQSYATLVSGVLIGLTEGLQSQGRTAASRNRRK